MQKLLTGLACVCAMLCAMPSYAQRSVDGLTKDQTDEMYCVFDSLSARDAADLSDEHVGGDVQGEGYKMVMANLERVATTCSDKFSWSADRKLLSARIALHTAVVETVGDILTDGGLTEKDFGQIYQMTASLSESDIAAFANGSWKDDRQIVGRMASDLLDRGIRGGPNVIHSMFIMEARIVSADAIDKWILGLRKT